jgi:GGDEF domain-containing protein
MEYYDFVLLQTAELFAKLSWDEVDFVASHSNERSLKKGEVLFSPGEKAKQFYILKSGAIRVFKKHNDGEEEIAMFTNGDTIGDFDFARGAEYDACAEAAKNSELIEFPGSGHTMDSATLKKPDYICKILLNAIVMMTGRIKSVNKLILENLSWVQEIHRRAYEDSSTGLWRQILIADEIIGVLKEPSAIILLKPDRFKILVDSRGHSAGDEAMIKIALILKNITRKIESNNKDMQSWAIRFKSNEVGIIINNCDALMAEETVKELFQAVADMERVPAQDDIPEFHFSATISWTIWSEDCASDRKEWKRLFQDNYTSLMDNWKAGGERIIHYKAENK